MILANGCNIIKSEKFKGVWILSVPTVYIYMCVCVYKTLQYNIYIIYITFIKYLLFTKPAFIWSKIQQKQQYCEIFYTKNNFFLFEHIWQCNWFLWSKLNFQHHYSTLQCHMILQKSFWFIFNSAQETCFNYYYSQYLKQLGNFFQDDE